MTTCFVRTLHFPKLIKQLNFPGEDRTESGSPSKEIVEEFRQLQWMKTAILKRRNASDTEFREVLQGLLHSIEFSEECINDFLQEMSALAEARPSLVADAAGKLINHALRDVNGHSFIDKIRFHLKADANQQRATLEIGSACDDTAGRPGFQFGKAPARACQSVLWDMVDKLYNSNKWSRAVRWYCLSSHEIFARAVAPVTVSGRLRYATFSWESIPRRWTAFKDVKLMAPQMRLPHITSPFWRRYIRA